MLEKTKEISLWVSMCSTVLFAVSFIIYAVTAKAVRTRRKFRGVH